ncbi:MAG: hypothetical protein ACFFFH_09080 [Candidatus Thorarchaeota archaeon]
MRQPKNTLLFIQTIPWQNEDILNQFQLPVTLNIISLNALLLIGNLCVILLILILKTTFFENIHPEDKKDVLRQTHLKSITLASEESEIPKTETRLKFEQIFKKKRS